MANILTTEMGKPLAEAKGEVMFGSNFLEWYSEEAKRNYGDVSNSSILITSYNCTYVITFNYI